MYGQQPVSTQAHEPTDGVVDRIFGLADEPVSLAEQAFKAEIDIQITTARRFPRTISAFERFVRDIALISPTVAGSCYYTLPRKKKKISGPSIRFAEIVASAWGHIRTSAHIVGIGDEYLTVVGTAHDVERNVAMSEPVMRRIVDSGGRRYNVDMIQVTARAACSIATRNAIFRVVPRALTEPLLEECKRVSLGQNRAIEENRAEAVKHWSRQGVSESEMCRFVGVAKVSDLGTDELTSLLGLWNAIGEGHTSIEAERRRIEQEAEDAGVVDRSESSGFNLDRGSDETP